MQPISYLIITLLGAILFTDSVASTVPTTQSADIVVKQLAVWQYDIHGQLIQSLKTPLLKHFPIDNSHLLKQPSILVAQNNQPLWHIQAGSARAVDDHITFSNQVIIRETPNATGEYSTLITKALIFFPKEQRATTREHVLIQNSAGHRIEAMGMNAFLTEQRIQLLHQTRGLYVPPSHT